MLEDLNYKEIASFIIAGMFLALSLWINNTGTIVLSFILLFVLQNTEFEVRIGKINIKW